MNEVSPYCAVASLTGSFETFTMHKSKNNTSKAIYIAQRVMNEIFRFSKSYF